LVDALITGGSETPVLNLFHATDDQDGPEDLLLGPLLLAGLRRLKSRKTVTERFERIGFGNVAIENALRELERAGVFYEIGGAALEIRVIHEVLEGNLALLKEAAYLDIMAMTTPVDEALHPYMEIEGSGAAQDHFLARAWNALTFLAQIYFDEHAFARAIGDPATAAKEAGSLSLPSIFRLCADAYQNRLKELQKSKVMTISETEWEELLNHQVLKLAASWPLTFQEVIKQATDPKSPRLTEVTPGRRLKASTGR
jgi:hypothetical protein